VLWYRLERPSGYKVAARFKAAGRPIDAKSVIRWKKQGWQHIEKVRKADSATPAEARAVWESLEKPSYDKVVAALKAQGRKVCHGTVWNWKRAGWPDVAAKTGAKTAAKTSKATRTMRSMRLRRAKDKPTPAEAMKLYYSLEKPSSREVAARFTAAGRPIVARTITRWRRQGWPGVPNAPRTNRPSPAEAQAIWDSLEQPTLQKVVDAFKAQGRPIGCTAIWSWKQTGWSRITAKNAVAKATKAIEKIDAAVPALTGDPMTTLSDILGNDGVPGERHDDARHNDKPGHGTRSNADHIERVMFGTMRTAVAVRDPIFEIAAAVPEADVLARRDTPTPVLVTRAGGLAALVMASNAGVGVAFEGFRRLPAIRAEEKAEAGRA
jgi:hypothetical protein